MKKLFIVCNRSFFPYLQDLPESLKECLNFTFIFYDDPNKIIPEIDNENIYICLKQIPTWMISSNSYRENCYFLNTEQVSDNRFMNLVKEMSTSGFRILDYSPSNVKLARLEGITNIQYMPYIPLNQSLDSENAHLRRLIKETPKIYDVAFCGALSERRKRILRRLKKYVNIIHVQGWREQRDLQIASAKILINIHYNDNYKIFEHLRCDRWIFAGMVVLTETSALFDESDIKDLVIVKAYKHIVNMASQICTNYKYYENVLRNKLLTIGPRILKNRLSIIDKFATDNDLEVIR